MLLINIVFFQKVPVTRGEERVSTTQSYIETGGDKSFMEWDNQPASLYTYTMDDFSS